MQVWQRLGDMVGSAGAAALVTLAAVRGSAPREAGARMVVRPDGAFFGTIGGGRLEWRALEEARRALAAGRGPARLVDEALGPDLGQCCGGFVTILIETFDRRDAAAIAALAAAEAAGPLATVGRMGADGRVARLIEPAAPAAGEVASVDLMRPRGRREAGSDLALQDLVLCERFEDGRTPLLLFGAGHVGRALVLALAPLPFRLRWVDPREEAFPPHVPMNVTPVFAPDPPAEARAAPTGALVLVMTHDHPLDLAVVAAALARPDLPFVGLIGSATKRARFLKRLGEAGLGEAARARLVCPIGVPGIAGKEPAVIAAAVAAQLLQVRERLRRAASARGERRVSAGADDRFLARAVALSREHMLHGDGGPFGAVVVRDGFILGEGWNCVTSQNDPTAHAEVVAIRRACAAAGAFALHGATLYASCEPCPMCLAAAYWARLARIVYANTREAAAAIGFDDAFIYGEMPKAPGERSLVMEHRPLAEAAQVFADWLAKADRIPY
ncbi:xanthine dehydrogenase accessory protein XdhC [Chelatococcus sp. SYSU_G07232]|uniref:Xanthine dehydrogenase accessory protein XdhC n=1 Tax=Chelatococcus albus TaxID=3047466 RepID=A0ABT7AHZ7_9HYPH|nr:xanthine dehydrogenase accessory protein XdhC [Chelatococcus sp. SYSU_G07232]MDJ1158989.1 xanthine dehydrogenase accessory protein XdhC [Chelatococcus sp. SYSU_G07232]